MGPEDESGFINPSSLSGLGKKVTVGPYELVVIMRNGEVTEIFEEGQIKTLGVRDSIKRLGGFGPELSVGHLVLTAASFVTRASHSVEMPPSFFTSASIFT